MNRVLVLALMLASSVALVNSCGGDVVAGVEGSGAPTPDAPGVGMVSNGRISGLGSIFVGGTEFSLDHASITVDGQPGTAADLMVGKVVTLTGTVLTTGNQLTAGTTRLAGSAATVSTETDVGGRIDAVSADGGLLTVLGQSIVIGLLTNTTSAFHVGDLVRMSGFRRSTGIWTARHISLAPPGMVLHVSGVVTAVGANHSLQIGNLSVDTTAATLSGFPGAVAAGMNIHVTGKTLSAGGVLIADTLNYLSPALPGATGDDAYVEGWVTGITAMGHVLVNDHPVNVGDTPVYPSAPNQPDSIAVDDFLRVSGTRNSDGSVAAYAIERCSFLPGPPRSGHQAVLLRDGRVLLTGGPACGERLELFDPATGLYSLGGLLASSDEGTSATLLQDGRVFLAGRSSAEIYDPATNALTFAGNLRTPRGSYTATLLGDGRVLLAGGVGPGGGGGLALANAEAFDPRTNTFTAVGNMNSARASHTATLMRTGEVLIAGGWNGHPADAADNPPWDPQAVELFDPNAGTFRSSAQMSTTRAGHGNAVALANGSILLLGGIWDLQNLDVQPSHPAYAELFDPAAEAIAALNTTAPPQRDYTTIQLPSGQILLLGGQVKNQAVATALLLDPATGTVTTGPSLTTARYGHTATLLPDGRVLVMGGTDANGNTLASFEYWEGIP